MIWPSRPTVDDLIIAELPPTAWRRTLAMDGMGGRDQVARALRLGWDRFEAPTPAWFFAVARRRPGLILDVGANTGFYALLGAAASSRNRVIAFEPDRRIADLLDRNRALNGLRSRIRVRRTAVSDQTGRGFFHIPPRTHGLVDTSGSLNADFLAEHEEVMPVPLETLDGVMAAAPRGTPRVTLVKIDVEAHEPQVLEGARDVVARHRPVVIVEVLHMADLGRLGRFLSDHDYVSYLIQPETPPTRTREVAHHSVLWNHAFVPTEEADAFENLIEV